jgi:hypothetical protein
MNIAVGKLAVYTAAAGVHRDRVIAVMLDAGTDNERLRDDPVYVGNRHARVRGERYDALIAAYVECAHRLFPHALLHWEDFGPANARRILLDYRDLHVQRRHPGDGRDRPRRGPRRDAGRRDAPARAARGDLRRGQRRDRLRDF